MNTIPIEFMAWDIESPCLLTWDEIQDQWGCEGYHPAILSGDHYIPMQLTALRSINDEPIYNHMIVKDEYGKYAVVDMFDYTSMFGLSQSHLEIVGNRFQRPELLEMCK